jgi:hypothetical protein
VALQRPIIISGTYRLIDLFYLFVVYLDLITLLSNRDYTVSNERVLNKLWIGKYLEGCGLILRNYSGIRPGGTE